MGRSTIVVLVLTALFFSVFRLVTTKGKVAEKDGIIEDIFPKRIQKNKRIPASDRKIERAAVQQSRSVKIANKTENNNSAELPEINSGSGQDEQVVYNGSGANDVVYGSGRAPSSRSSSSPSPSSSSKAKTGTISNSTSSSITYGNAATIISGSDSATTTTDNDSSSSSSGGGLERNCAVACGASFIDGSVGQPDWWYAIGSYASYGGGGAPSTVDISSAGVPHTQLWTRRAEGNFTKRSCKEILDAGLSTGSGFYVIDPDGVGGEPGVRVYCEMTIDGGGWTRVSFNYGPYNSTKIPADFLVKEYRRDFIGLNGLGDFGASLNAEKFSKLVGTSGAMLMAPSYGGSPYIDNSTGIWQYDTPRCSGTLLHTERAAGCLGQNAHDQFNIAFEGGAGAIVPNYPNYSGELCYPGNGSCNWEFYLR